MGVLLLENSWGGKGLLGRNMGSRLGFLKRGWKLGLGLHREGLGVGRERGLGEGLGEAGFGVGVEGAGGFGLRILKNVLAWLGFG